MSSTTLKLDKNTVSDLETRGVEKILVFLYEAGCSGTKVDIKEDFEIGEDMVLTSPQPSPTVEGVDTSVPPLLQERGLGGEVDLKIYIYKKDADKFDGAIITKLQVDKNDDNPHLKGVKEKYIFSNPKILDRCGCGTSFSFEKKKIEIDLEKLKSLRERFGK